MVPETESMMVGTAASMAVRAGNRELTSSTTQRKQREQTQVGKDFKPSKPTSGDVLPSAMFYLLQQWSSKSVDPDPSGGSNNPFLRVT